MAFDPNAHFLQTALLSKINVAGSEYYVKDAEARAALEAEINKLGAAAYKAYADTINGAGLVDAATVKNYVDAQVGSINKFDVVVDNAGSAIAGPSVTASADTMYKLYLVPANDASAGEYIEYITIRSGSEGAYTYKWEQIGSTKLSLTGYVTEDALAAALLPYEKKENLKALAYKDSASGTVAGHTVTGVKATGTSAGSITVELNQTSTELASAGKFTPAGNIAGTVATDGTIAVSLAHTGTAAQLTKGDYTPAGDVSVALSGGTFNQITSVGTAASFTEGAFTPATLTYAESDAFAKEGLVGSVSGETLTLTAASTGKASVISAFDGGSKAKDTFVANTPAAMAEHSVGVQSASFTGTKLEGALVTGVTYDKAAVDTATFTGKTVDIAATFTGTEGDIAVSGNYDKASVKTAAFNGAQMELAVGDIVCPERTITVQ